MIDLTKTVPVPGARGAPMRDLNDAGEQRDFFIYSLLQAGVLMPEAATMDLHHLRDFYQKEMALLASAKPRRIGNVPMEARKAIAEWNRWRRAKAAGRKFFGQG